MESEFVDSDCRMLMHVWAHNFSVFPELLTKEVSKVAAIDSNVRGWIQCCCQEWVTFIFKYQKRTFWHTNKQGGHLFTCKPCPLYVDIYIHICKRIKWFVRARHLIREKSGELIQFLIIRWLQSFDKNCAVYIFTWIISRNLIRSKFLTSSKRAQCFSLANVTDTSFLFDQF